MYGFGNVWQMPSGRRRVNDAEFAVGALIESTGILKVFWARAGAGVMGSPAHTTASIAGSRFMSGSFRGQVLETTIVSPLYARTEGGTRYSRL